MSEGKHLPFDEGLPTRPDVDLLLRTWPEPKVGDRYPYEAIEKLLNLSSKDNRFRTVTTNWRKRLHEQFSVVVESEAGEAFYVASADEISARTYGVLKFVGRKAHKHRRKLAVAKIENDQQRATVEHQARLMLAVEKDAKKGIYIHDSLPHRNQVISAASSQVISATSSAFVGILATNFAMRTSQAGTWFPSRSSKYTSASPGRSANSFIS